MPTPNQNRLHAFYKEVRAKYKEIGNISEVARIYGIKRQRAWQIVREYKRKSLSTG